jgi:hypothetical protein
MWMRIRLFDPMRIRIQIPSFQIKAQTLKKMFKKAHIPHILACHLQIDADPDLVLDPAYHFDADPDADPGYQKLCGYGSTTLHETHTHLK